MPSSKWLCEHPSPQPSLRSPVSKMPRSPNSTRPKWPDSSVRVKAVCSLKPVFVLRLASHWLLPGLICIQGTGRRQQRYKQQLQCAWELWVWHMKGKMKADCCARRADSNDAAEIEVNMSKSINRLTPANRASLFLWLWLRVFCVCVGVWETILMPCLKQ